MKRKLIIEIAGILMILSLVSCGSKADVEDVSATSEQESVFPEEDSATAAEEILFEQETPDSSEDDVFQAATTDWPEEFGKWGIPIINTATVTLADNRSSNGDMMTQGVNAIVNLADVSKSDFEEYCTKLENEGFEKSSDSIGDSILIYVRSIEGGEIEMTLSYATDGTTIIANNSAVTAQKDAAAGGTVDWPDALKAVPAFSKGKFKETVDMGGNMYTITFNEVSASDLDDYKNELLSNGFQRQDSEDTEGYMKMDSNSAYSVGFILSGDSLQIIIYLGTY